MPNETEHVLQAILAEYNALRTEVFNRTGVQSTLLQLHVTALTTIIGAMLLQANFGFWLIFLIPIESAMFGLLWLDHAIRIEKLGQFIAMIEKKVNDVVGKPDIMSMEISYSRKPNAGPQKPIPSGPLFVWTFGGSCLLAFLGVGFIILANPSAYQRGYEGLIGFLLVLDIFLSALYFISARYYLDVRRREGRDVPRSKARR